MRRSNHQFHAAASSNRTNSRDSDKTFSRRSKMKRVLRKENILLIATLLILFTCMHRNGKLENDEGRIKRGENNEANHEAERDANNEVNYSNDWKVGDMWENLDCEEIFKSERPIHSHSTWNHARTLYRDIVGEESSIGETDDEPNGFSVPAEAKQSPPKGRGIFALRDITAGELIWSTKKTARFQDGPSYRKFIFGVEAGFACDVLQWAYVQDIGDGELRVSVDLDEGCFCNDGGGDDEANTGCDEEAARDVEGGCRENYFAMSDIQAGEELLCSYGQFAISGGWKRFGL